MKYQLVITIFVFTTAVFCKADNAVCAENSSFGDGNYDDIQRVVDKLVQDIDREVGSGCMIDRKFIENSGNVWGDVEAIGACRTSNDLKQTLYAVKKYFGSRFNLARCRNYRIVSHGDTVASRIRVA